MKELSIEEKAKRYDKALNRAKGFKTIEYRDVAEYIFPELAESEDDKLREQVVYAINQLHVCECTKNKLLAWLKKQGECNINHDDEIMIKQLTEFFLSHRKYFIENTDETIVEWLKDVRKKLEKQREQKPTDKVEPKFHEGEWVVYDHRVYQVVELPKEGYINLGLRRNGKIEFAPSTYCRPWTIKDAKDGDILMANAPFIFNGNLEGGIGCPGAHCGINTLGEFIIPEYTKHWTGHTTTPATKEQRDLLFAKMKEAGYEWNAEKKELKRVVDEEQIKKNLQDNSFRRMFEQNPWSEEDESWFKEIELMCFYFSNDANYREKFFTWLKSIKERVQPKQWWSEEDDEKYLDAIEKLIMGSRHTGYNGVSRKDAVDWLKSLCPQKQWKPSEEQIKALGVATNISNVPEKEYIELEKLYQDLIKLRGK